MGPEAKTLLALMIPGEWYSRSEIQEKYGDHVARPMGWCLREDIIEIKDNTWPQEIRRRTNQEIFDLKRNASRKI